MDIIIVFLLLAIIGTVFALFKFNGQTNSKSSAVKKHELMKQYEDELKNILSNCSSEDERSSKKVAYIKQLNQTLSRNLFFTQSEAKDFIQKLASF